MPPNIQNERLETRIRELENQVKQISRRGNVFSEPVVIYLDGRNLQFGTSSGSKIGTSTSQKISFWNASPSIQPTNGANLTNNVTAGGSNDVIANFTDLSVYANDAAAK